VAVDHLYIAIYKARGSRINGSRWHEYPHIKTATSVAKDGFRSKKGKKSEKRRSIMLYTAFLDQ